MFRDKINLRLYTKIGGSVEPPGTPPVFRLGMHSLLALALHDNVAENLLDRLQELFLPNF